MRSLLLAVCVLLSASPSSAQASGQIRLNQVGFYPDGPKRAVVVGTDATTFEVHRSDGTTALAGALSDARRWSPSGETVRQADFSAVTEPGTYTVVVPGIGASVAFEVEAHALAGVARASLKAFYFQRASAALPAAYAGAWARSAGHPDDRVLVHASAASAGRPAGTILASPRGWYDAGDYNKYIVNSGITVGTLLGLAEAEPDYVASLDTNIPESGNGVPDLVDEVLWNVRWMLTMQDPADGGVYHKLTTAGFEGFVMPAQARSTRYVVQKGTAATLDFAAVAAQTARVVAPYEATFPGLADSLRAASVAAWRWARAHPAVQYSQSAVNAAFDPDVNTGEYGDSQFSDEFDWAAMELYLTTRADSFLTLRRPLSPVRMETPYWGSVRALGYYSLLRHRTEVATDVDTTALRNALLAQANGFVSNVSSSAYGVVMGGRGYDYGWGSNSNAANQGVVLLLAYQLTGDAAYLDAATANLDYLLGRNATGYSFVTGVGDTTPLYPHHRPSGADGVAAPVPGLLAGGPNPGREDGCPGYPSTLPARSYLDTQCSYATNEIAINWNAPLVALAGGIEAVRSARVTSASEEPSASAADLGLRVSPNPARGDVTVAFRLAASGPVTLRVFDLTGREVAVVRDTLAAGDQRLPLSTAGLPAGLYAIRVEAQGGAQAVTVSVVR